MADQKKEKDKDLDNLLDSALADFDKTPQPKSSGEAVDKKDANASGDVANANAISDDPDAFFVEQAKILAERMNTLFAGAEETTQMPSDVPATAQNSEQIVASFQKMAEAAAKTLQGENTASDEDVARYSDSIAQALRGLQEGADNLSQSISDNDVANMFGGLSLENASEGDNAFLPFMEGMMQSLLSAEILLPSIKELLEKYPKYLTDNADKLSPEDKERYEKQLDLYKVIEGHLEEERPDDTPAVKREKFKMVLDDMRKLQEFGHPPEEIIAETAGDLPIMDPNAIAGVGQNPQCPMM